MSIEQNISELKIRPEKIKNSISPSKYKYLNLKSIDNFITHFEKIIPNSKKEFVLYNLNSFLDAFEEIEPSTITEYLEIYNSFIVPVGRLYSAKANFSFVTRPKYYALYLIIAILILILAKFPLWVNFLSLLSILLVTYSILKSLRSNRAWGVSY